jgi:N,N'-diacetyllegionaminate synthase
MTSRSVFIIAEAAQGYEGVPALAKLLVRAASVGGADAVKFQIVYADELATPAYRYYDLYRQLEMTRDDWAGIAAEARKSGLHLIFDVFGPESLRLALDLGAAVKLHSADFFNDELVSAALEQARELFLSIGGITADELEAFLERHNRSSSRITVMFGYQAEPTNIQDNHLSRLLVLQSRFPQVKFGFMDHADGESDEATWLGAMAVAMGARVVEKHVTLERALKMEDYVSALSGPEFARYVARIRSAELALGANTLELSLGEREYRTRSVKVVVTRAELRAGVPIPPASLVTLRAPVDEGRRPLTRIEEAVHRLPARAIPAGTPVYADDLR